MWKEGFHGLNYDRLKEIKTLYDPEDLFYASTAVGVMFGAWRVMENFVGLFR